MKAFIHRHWRSQQSTRTVYFTQEANAESHFSDNQTKTTKYNLITFLPKSIILQFLRPANWVYLITAIAQSIPQISSLSPVTAVAPLMFVLAVALLKQGIQDYKRHVKDNQINNQTAYRLINSEWIEVKWAHLKVGDIVRVKDQEMIPADLILLYSTQQNSICYVMTANLDGESNLKTKNACQEIKLYPQQFQSLKGEIVIQKPNSNLHQFHGVIKLQKRSANIQRAEFDINSYNINKGVQNQTVERQISLENLLVRGSVLRNTDYAVGVLVYAGPDTKIMKNQGDIRHKVSHVEGRVNIIQLFLLFALILLSMGCAIGYYRYHTSYAMSNRGDFFYLAKGGVRTNMVYESVLIFFTCFLLLSFLIPISMNVALQGIKIFQGFFIGWDQKMYYKPLNKYCNALNLSIIEQLGLIDYVLTDKTGTLTANQMKFQYAFIEGKKYEAQILVKQYQGQKDIQFNKDFLAFWLSVIICHDVVLDTKKGEFQGSSPDQVCFLEYAARIGYKFIKRTKNSIELQVNGKKLIYEYLQTIPFNHRKRMSVIVRDLQKKQIILYTKGADSAMLNKANQGVGKRRIHEYEKHLTTFSTLGLRTLVFGKRQMQQQEMQAYLKELNEIKNYKLKGVVSAVKKKEPALKLNANNNIQIMKGISQERFMSSQHQIVQIETMMASLMEDTESNLQLLGVSAIEDRLQDRVPQTISRLQEAGIVVMMITGDKLQTAENIGYLSNFIRKDATVFRLKAGTLNLNQQILTILSNIIQNSIMEFSVLIQGEIISKYLNADIPQAVELLKKCKSVIFCRSTPKQKALIVTFVKEKLKGIVLAIGDGGNDIGMIQQANIGVGLIGKEGNQAASSSDFYFAQFRFLDRLILHHGRWTYYRMSYFFVYYGWKNLTMTLILFWFSIYSVFSGFPGLSEPFITVYNSVIALILVTYYTVLEQDINEDDYPEAYSKLPTFYLQFKNLKLFSYRRYILWSVLAILLSLLIHFGFQLVLGSTEMIDGSGHPADFNTYASGIAIALSTAVTFVIIIDVDNYTWFSFWIILVLLTFLPSIAFFIIENYAALTNANIQYALTDNFSSLRYIATMWLMIAVTVIIKFGYNQIKFLFYPSGVDKCMYSRNKQKQLEELSEQPPSTIHENHVVSKYPTIELRDVNNRKKVDLHKIIPKEGD